MNVLPDRRRVLALLAAGAGLPGLAAGAALAAEDLLGRMTLEEKIGQLTMLSANLAVTGPVVAGNVTEAVRAGRVGSLFNLWGREAVREAQRVAVEETRLGIPLLFGLDVLHGFRTVFPIPLAETGAFDPALWEETARLAAREAAGAGLDLTFAPMLDVARDQRWGRIAEGPGEDPCVAARFAAAKVRGFQGAALSGLASTAKHFVAYGASTAGRDYAPVDVSERALAEVYLPPFRAAVEAGVAAVMPAFTDVAGVPLTASRRLLREHPARGLGFSRRRPQRLRRDRRADPARRGRRSRRGRGAGARRRGRHRHDVRRLPARPARGAAARAGPHGRSRRRGGRVLALKARLGLLDDPYRRCAGPDPETRAARAEHGRRRGAPPGRR